MGNNETPLALREPLADHANRGDIYTISISLAIYVTLAWEILYPYSLKTCVRIESQYRRT